MIIQTMPYPKVNNPSEGIATQLPDGAWIWFTEPRAISIGETPVVGVISTAGDLLVYDADATPTSVDLHGSVFGAFDDHANPSLLQRSSDGKILAFASTHSGPAIYSYLSTAANDPSAFGAETDLDATFALDRYTYPNPVQLTGETDDPIYLFFRADSAGTLHDWYSKSTDQGATWGAPVRLLSNNGGGGVAGHPPYFKVIQNGDSRIDIFCTDGHPQFQATNSIYHFYYDGGSFHKTDGTALTLPIAPATNLSKVYDGTTTKGWIWDCAIDGSGNPVVIYSTFPTTSDHRYNRAVWNGSSWDKTEICAAGGSVYAGSDYASAGVAVDPTDINTVFASRTINGVQTLFRYVLSGGSWSGTQVTADERTQRPFFIRGQTVEPRVAYMSGDYSDLDDYETSIKLIDSDTAAASDSTDPDQASVILHVRGDSSTDRSPVGRTLTYGANATRTGSKTIMAGGTTGIITAPDAADLAFAGDFCIELFGVTFDFSSIQQTLMAQWRAATGGRSWRVSYQGHLTPDQLGIYLSTDGTANTFVGGNWTPTGQHDLCFERSGSTVRVYADGVMIGSGTFSGALQNSPAKLFMGAYETGTGSVDNTAIWTGSWKEVRITTAARYTSDSGYTVPSRPLPTS